MESMSRALLVQRYDTRILTKKLLNYYKMLTRNDKTLHTNVKAKDVTRLLKKIY